MKKQNESCAARGAEQKTLGSETPLAREQLSAETGLAPCPFCGGKADEESGITQREDIFWASVFCTNRLLCQAEVTTTLNNQDGAERNARLQWNKRVPLIPSLSQTPAATPEETKPSGRAPLTAPAKDLEGATRTRLGESNTEQFEIVTRVHNEEVHRQKLHDPFVRTSTTLKGLGHAWRCLTRKGLTVTTFVNGSHGAMRDVMNLDPVAMARPVPSADSTPVVSRENKKSVSSPLPTKEERAKKILD